MPFASEEAVVMLFSVAKETEPWTLQAGGRGGKDFISLLSLLCNFDSWSVTEWVGTEGLSEVYFQNRVSYLLMFVSMLK